MMSRWSRRPDLSGRLTAALRAYDPVPVPAVDLRLIIACDDAERFVAVMPAAVDPWAGSPLLPSWLLDRCN